MAPDFAEMDISGPGGDMSELNAFLLSKLLWNPDVDTDAAIGSFLRGFYGTRAATFVMESQLL